MKGLLIQALNEQGKEAIQQHLTESSRKKKLVFKQRVVSENPFVLEIKVSSVFARLVNFHDFRNPIDKAMLDNGACPEDYRITEVVR